MLRGWCMGVASTKRWREEEIPDSSTSHYQPCIYIVFLSLAREHWKRRYGFTGLVGVRVMGDL
jgi:hypothetical protein